MLATSVQVSSHRWQSKPRTLWKQIPRTEEQRYIWRNSPTKENKCIYNYKNQQCISEANGKATIQWRCLLESRWFPRKAFRQAPRCSCTTPDVFRLKAALGHQHTHTKTKHTSMQCNHTWTFAGAWWSATGSLQQHVQSFKQTCPKIHLSTISTYTCMMSTNGKYARASTTILQATLWSGISSHAKLNASLCTFSAQHVSLRPLEMAKRTACGEHVQWIEWLCILISWTKTEFHLQLHIAIKTRRFQTTLLYKQQSNRACKNSLCTRTANVFLHQVEFWGYFLRTSPLQSPGKIINLSLNNSEKGHTLTHTRVIKLSQCVTFSHICCSMCTKYSLGIPILDKQPAPVQCLGCMSGWWEPLSSWCPGAVAVSDRHMPLPKYEVALCRGAGYVGIIQYISEYGVSAQFDTRIHLMPFCSVWAKFHQLMREFELNLHSQQPVADCVLLGTEDVCQAQCDKGKTTGIILLQELLTKLGSICWSLSQWDCLRFTHSNILKNMQLHSSQSHQDCCLDHHPWTKFTRMISHAMHPWVSIWLMPPCSTFSFWLLLTFKICVTASTLFLQSPSIQRRDFSARSHCIWFQGMGLVVRLVLWDVINSMRRPQAKGTNRYKECTPIESIWINIELVESLNISILSIYCTYIQL